MKTKIFLGLLLIAFSLQSCNRRIAGAQYVASKFYDAMMQQHYDDVYPLLDGQALEKQSFSQWKSTLQALIYQRGLLQHYSKSAVDFFKDNDKNDIVKLTYKVTYANGIFYETLTLIRRPGKMDFKIIEYNY